MLRGEQYFFTVKRYFTIIRHFREDEGMEEKRKNKFGATNVGCQAANTKRIMMKCMACKKKNSSPPPGQDTNFL